MGSMPLPIDLSPVLLGCTFSGVAPGYLLNPFGLVIWISPAFTQCAKTRLRNLKKE